MNRRRITAQQLHRETKRALDLVEAGENFVITRFGRAVARLAPIDKTKSLPWDDIMRSVWKAQREVRRRDVMDNPVLVERTRRRR